MQTYTTKNNTTLYYDVDYTLGGYNYFTSQVIERGYYLEVSRQRGEFAAFEGLEHSAGSVRMLILPVGRQSKKRAAESKAIALEQLQKLLARDYPEL